MGQKYFKKILRTLFVKCLIVISFAKLIVNDVHGMSAPCTTLPIVNVPVVGDPNSGPCGPGVTHYIVDLSSSPDTTWISPSETRFRDTDDPCNTCCSANVQSPDNERCVSFELTLHPSSAGIRFFIASGASPGGSLGWREMFPGSGTCGVEHPGDMDVCLDGPGPHFISFCKPGNNPNSYGITSFGTPGAGPTDIVSDACDGEIWGVGYDETTVVWNSVSPGAYGAHNGYLSPSNTGEDTVVVNFVDGAPDSVFYEICGVSDEVDAATCPVTTVCDTTSVEFVQTLSVEIQPKDPVICFGSTIGVTLTAVDSGGKAPILYDWSPTNETTQDIQAMTPGWYDVTVYDNSGCPTASDSVEVTAYALPILADAGNDTLMCENNFSVQLNGSVQIASGGTWTSSGDGTFDNDTLMNATYTAGPNDLLLSGTGTCIELYLTTTPDPGGCPGDVDTMCLTLAPTPTVDAGLDAEVCANAGCISLTATSSTGAGTWSGGGGTLSAPNSLTTNYCPSAGERNAAPTTVTLFFQTRNNGSCLPVRDSVIVSIAPAAIVDAGTGATLCANNSEFTTNGTVTNPDGGPGTGIWTTSGDGSFNGTQNLLAATYTPGTNDATTGNVVLTLTSTSNTSGGGATCIATSDTIHLNITPAPTIDIGDDVQVCQNNDLVEDLTAVTTVATGLTWTAPDGVFSAPGNNITDFNPDAGLSPMPYNIEVIATTTGSGNCNEVSDTLNISITPRPSINFDVPTRVCQNDPEICITNMDLQNATGVLWFTGAGGTSFNSSNTDLEPCYTPNATELGPAGVGGNVILFAQTTGVGNCTPVTKDTVIIIFPSPQVSIVQDTVCENNPIVDLDGTVIGGGTTTWTTSGSGTFDNTGLIDAQYDATNDVPNPVTLTLTSVLDIPGFVTCNPVSADMVLTYSPSPTANAGPNQSLCANNPVVTTNGSVTLATGGTWISLGDGSFNGTENNLIATYTPGVTDLADTNVYLVLTTTGNGDCNPVSDTMQVIFTPAPVVDAGLPQDICSNNLCNIALSGSVTVATGGTWSTAGGGSFSPNATNLNTSYCADDADTLLSPLDIILTSTGNANCNPVADTTQITFTPSPTVVGTGDTVCANNSLATVSAVINAEATGVTWSGGGGVINSPNTLTTTYQPTAGERTAGIATLYVQTTGNGNCSAVRDTVRIVITPAPTVNAGANRTVCANNPQVTLNGSVTNATGGNWISLSGNNAGFGNQNVLNTTYLPNNADTAAGSVCLVLTTTGVGNCSPVSDTMCITITPAPTVEAGPPQSVCQNNPVITLDGSVTVATGGNWTSSVGGSYSPNASDLGASFNPSNPTVGTITFTLTTTGNGSCLQVTDQVDVTVTPAPTISAGPDVDVCADAPAINLNGSVTVATGGIWNAGGGTFGSGNNTTLIDTYIPTPGQISGGGGSIIIVSNGNANCSPVSDTMNYTIAPIPVVEAGPDQVVCGNVANVSLNGTVTDAGGGQWTSGSGNNAGFGNQNVLNTTYSPSATDLSNGFVVLTLTSTGNGDCNPVTDTVRLDFENAPTVNAGPDETICSNEYPIQLQGSGTQGTWSGGLGGYSPNASTLNATYMPDPSETGTTIQLILTTDNIGACPQISDTVNFTLLDGPTVDAGNDQTVCGDVSSVTMNGSFGGTSTGMQWTRLAPATGTFVSTTDPATDYNITAQDRNNGLVQIVAYTTGTGSCPIVTDTMSLIITPAPTVDAGFPQTVCADAGTVNLDGTITVAGGGVWSSPTGTFVNDTIVDAVYNIDPADTTNGSVTLTLCSTDNGTCNQVCDDVTITITPAPTIDAGNDATICADSNAYQLDGSYTVATGITWTAIDGDGTFSPSNVDPNALYFPSNQDTTDGVVTLVISTGNSVGTCSPITDTMVLTITPAPTIFAGNDATICADQPTIGLQATINAAAGGATWDDNLATGSFSNPNILNPTYTFGVADTTFVTFTATTTGSGMCREVSDQVNVTITPRVGVYAGPDGTYCADANNIILNGSVTVATGGRWELLSGTGVIADTSSLVTTYTPSAADTAAGCITLTLTSTGNGLCQPVTDTLEICFNPVPVPEAGPDGTICADSAYYELAGVVANAGGGQWSTSGTGNFFPNNSTLNAQYIPSNADTLNGQVTLYLTTTGNGICSAVTDSMTLIITPAPTLNVGSDLTICADNDTVSLTSLLTVATDVNWTTSGSGSFTPNPGTSTSYLVHDNDDLVGTVNITGTTLNNGSCNAVSQQLTITITDRPTVDAGNDQNVCGDQASITLNGTVTDELGNPGTGTWSTPNGEGSFDDLTTLVANNYTFDNQDSIDGTLDIILTSTSNGTCNPVSDTITINLQPGVLVNVNDDITVCEDTSFVQLSSSYETATGIEWFTSGNGSFSVNQFDSTAIYVISDDDKTNGGATLTIVTTGNGICPADTDQVNLTITPAPEVNPGADQTVCADDPTINLNGSVSVTGTGQWSTGSGTGSFLANNTDLTGTFTPTNAQITAGTVIITLTSTNNGQCNPVDSNFTLTITPSVIVDAGDDVGICANTGSITLNGSVTNAGGGIWTTTGTGTFANDTVLNTSYTYSQGDSLNGSVTLILTSTGNGLCNPVSDSVTLTIQPLPFISASPDTVCGDIAFNIPLSATYNNAGGMQWTTTVGSGSFIPNTVDSIVEYDPLGPADLNNSPFFIFARTTGNGVCPAAVDTAVISIRQTPVVNAGQDILVCANNAAINLSGTYTNATGVQWSSTGGGVFGTPTDNTPTDALSSYTISATDISLGGGTIYLTTTNNGLCPAVVDSIDLVVTPAPTINAGPPVEICADNDTVDLSAIVTTATGAIWSLTGAADGTFTNPASANTQYILGTNDSTNAPQTLTLQVETTGNGNCIPVTDTKTINVTPAPTLNVFSDLTFCEDYNAINFTAVYTTAVSGDWTSNSNGTFSPNTTNNTITYNLGTNDTVGGTFTVTFTTDTINGCKSKVASATGDITIAPTVDAGDANVCASVDTVPLVGSFTTATGIAWYTTNGTGTFTDSLNPVTGYIPSAADKASASPIEIIIETTGNGDCNERFDTVSISISDPIVVSAGVDDTVCADTAGYPLDGAFANSDSAMWSTLGSGTFVNQFDTNTTYIPSAADIDSGFVQLVIESVGNGFCDAEYDTLNLTITPAPTIDITAVSTCTDRDTLFIGSNYTIATGILWSTDGDGAFIPGGAATSTLDDPDYELGVNDKINGTFNIYVETTGNGLCKTYYDTLPVELIPAPTAYAGEDTSICEDADTLGIDGSVFVFGGGGGVWSTTGNGTFDDSTSLITTYNFGNQDTIGGSVTLYLTTTGGTCSPVTDSLVVTYTPAPTVDAGGGTVCIDNGVIPLNGSFTVAGGITWSSLGDGNFDDDEDPFTNYNTGAADIAADSALLQICTRLNGSCKTYCDTIQVNLDPGPVATITIDTICADHDFELDTTNGNSTTGFAVWSTLGGTGSFDNFDTLSSTNAIYVLGDADIDSGYVDFILTTTFNQDCDPAYDTARMVVTQEPIVVTLSSFTVCGDTAFVPLDGSVLNAGGGIWTTIDGTPGNIASPTSLSTSYTLTQADSARGSVTFVLESTDNGLCFAVRDTLVVNVTPIPTVNILDSLICRDVPNLPLSASITVATGGVWSTVNGSGSFAPSEFVVNGFYQQGPTDSANSPIQLVLTTTGNGMCKAYSDTLDLIITDPPSVDAGPSLGVCNDQDTICFNATYAIDNGATWSFTGGTGSFTPNNTDSSSCYVLGATDTAGTSIKFYYTTNGSSGCIPVTDSATITISEGPSVDAGLPDTICADANQLSLGGTYTVAGGVEWSTLTGGTFSPNVTDTLADYNISQTDSANGFVTLYLTTTFNGSCIPVTDSVRMIINPAPTVDAGFDNTICADSVGIDLAGIVNVATGGAWTTTGSGIFNPDTATLTATYEINNSDISDSVIVFTLTTTGNGLCNPVSDNMNLYITPRPIVDAGFPQTVCADADSVPLSGSINNIASGAVWSSLGGAGTGTFIVDTNLTTSFLLGSADITNGFVDLVLTTTGSGSCNEVSDTVRINITDSVTLNTNNDTTICQDSDEISLFSSFTVASGVSWSTSGDGSFSPDNVSDTIVYDISSNDSVQSSITISVQTTGNGTCKTQTDSIVITFDPLPIANAGQDLTTCADAPVVGLGGTVTNAPGGTWTTSGDGFFDLDTDLNTNYNLDGDDILNGLVDVFLTTDLVGTCDPDVDVMQIIINPAPTVDAGLNQEWCQDVNGIQLAGSFTIAGGVEWSTSGTGTFVDVNDPNTMYMRSNADITNGSVTLTLCTIDNDLCQPVCDSMVYTITPGPSVDAGPNDTLCADEGQVVLSGASYDGMPTSNLLWTTTTAGTFSNATVLTPTWTPDPAIIPVGNDAPLVVTFNLENQQSGSCNPVQDQRIVVFNPIPTLETEGFDTVCVDVDTIYLTSNVVNAQSVSWSSSGSGTFPNGNTGINVPYVPSQNDRNLNSLLFDAITVGAGLCQNVEDQVLVTFRERPDVDAGVDQRVCSNSDGIILDGSVVLASGGTWDVLTGAGSFVDNTDLGTIYTTGLNDTLNNGPVIIELTSAPYLDCKQYKDTMEITFDSEPTVSAGDASFCAEETGFPVSGSYSNAGGVLWSTSGDGTFFSPSDLGPTYVPGSNDRANDFARLYITAVTGNTCPDVTDSIDVTIIPLPISNAGFDVTICRGGSTDLIAEINPGTDYQWFTMDGTPIDMMNPIVTVTANNDTSFVLEATDQVYTTCSIFDTVNVNVFDPPSLNLPPHYCLYDTTVLNANPIPDTISSSYQWYERVPPNLIDFGTKTTTVDVAGSYIFAFVYDQCQVYDTTEVTDPPVVEHEDKIVCIGQTIDIEATSLTGVVYNWIEEATGDTVVLNSNPATVTADNDTINDQLFIVQVIDALGCITNDTVALSKLPPPEMTLENQPLCIGDEVTLNATPANVIDSLIPDAVFNWFVDGDSIPGEHDSILDVLVAGDYIVEFGIGECKALDTSRVDFFPLPVPDMQQKYEFCFDYETEMTISAGIADRYLWDESSAASNELTDSTLLVFGYGDFPVTIYNEYNCEARDTVEIVEVCEPRVYPPTGFIPNGEPCDPDCIDTDCNNCFFIKGAHYRNWNLRVYNRWGEVIFHSTNPDAEDGSGMWDGTYKGEPMPAGVYPWILYYEGDTPRHFGPYQIEGKITLIK